MKQDSLPLLMRIIREEFPAHKGKLFLAIICMILAAITTAGTAGLIDPAIKKIFIERDRSLLTILPLIIVAVSILRGITTFGQSVIMSKIGIHIVNRLQIKMFNKLLYMDLARLEEKHSGQMISYFIHDAMAMRDAASHLVVASIKEVLTLIGCAGIMFYQDWKLASMTLFIFLPVVVVIKRLMKKSSKSAQNIFEQTGNVSTMIGETIRGMRMIRIYGTQGAEAKKGADVFTLKLKFLFKELIARAASSPITEAMTGVGIALAIYYAGSEGLEGRMDVNNFMAFFAAMMMAYQPGRALSSLATRIQSGVVAAKRVYDILDYPIHILPPECPREINNIKGDIAFDNVGFAYAETMVLDQFSIQIKAGEKVAFVGASGSGKTTILNLIPRFYDPTQGRITLDNIDIKQFAPKDLRSVIALVSQDALLFNGTIRDNILLAKIDATPEELASALEKSALTDFIETAKDGLDTQVGEGGNLLSGGQKQRIAIARAFLKDAPILLLDEATSALDNQSEAQVQMALSRLSKNRTTITVAHRLSTIIDSDRIILISKGKIIGEGTHKMLLENNDYYAKLYQKEI